MVGYFILSIKDGDCVCEPDIVIANCPTNFLNDEPSLCGTVPVTWVEPTATDGCGFDVTVGKSHEPGSNFSAGVTTVSYVFTDSSQHHKTCEFKVSVSTIGKYYFNIGHDGLRFLKIVIGLLKSSIIVLIIYKKY